MKKHADIITVGLSRLNVAEDSFLSAYFKQIAFFITQFFKSKIAALQNESQYANLS